MHVPQAQTISRNNLGWIMQKNPFVIPLEADFYIFTCKHELCYLYSRCYKTWHKLDLNLSGNSWHSS